MQSMQQGQNSAFLGTAQQLFALDLCPVLLSGKKPVFQNFSDYLPGVGGPDEMTLPADKRPLRYTAELLQLWAKEFPFANIGVLTRERPTIDVDSEEIWKAISDLVPITPHIKRGARGFSLIYSQDARDPVLRTRTFTDRFRKEMVLEVLAAGRQTVLPPSIHPDSGRAYEWLTMPSWGVMLPTPLGPMVPPPLSQAVVDAIEERLSEIGIIKRRVARGEGRAHALADSERGRYEAYLRPKLAEKLAAVREAGAGTRQDALNGACYALAPWVREGFIDENQLEAEMREACMANGWIRADGDKAFTRQFQKALDDGWSTLLPDLDAGRAAQLMGQAPLLPPAHGSPAGSSPAAPVEWWTYDGTLPDEEPELIRRLLPASPGQIAFVAGKSQMGKSFYAAAMAVALGIGPSCSFFGQPVRERVGTVIIAAEGAGGMRARLYAAAEAMGARGTALPIVVIPRCGNLAVHAERVAMVEAIKRAAEHLRQAYGVRLGAVVLDTMLACFGMEDEGASAEAQSICNALREIGEAVSAVVVPIHHVGKDGTQGMRGSSAFYAAADYVVICGGNHDHETGETTNRYLAIDKSRNDKTGPISNVTLQIVTLGVNAYGDTRTTCFYAMGEGTVDPKGHNMKHGLIAANFDKAFQMIVARDGGESVPGPSLRMQFMLMHPGTDAAKRKAWTRICEKMIGDGRYKFENDLWSVKQSL